MGDHDYFHCANERRDLPARFAVDVSILIKNCIGIAKGMSSQFEIDVVFGVVNPVLVFVPLEPHLRPHVTIEM